MPLTSAVSATRLYTFQWRHAQPWAPSGRAAEFLDNNCAHCVSSSTEVPLVLDRWMPSPLCWRVECEELTNRYRDLVDMGLQREVAGVDETHDRRERRA
jgi:hypothetical protein